MSITATVENDMLRLPADGHLPDGTQVRLEPIAPSQPRRDWPRVTSRAPQGCWRESVWSGPGGVRWNGVRSVVMAGLLIRMRGFTT